MLKLIGTDANRYYTWDLNPGQYTIGRKTGSSKCDFMVSDMAVSRRHASLEVTADGKDCFLNDLDSHNGTFVNGIKIDGRTALSPGDTIQFGSAEFKIIQDTGISTTSPKPTQTKLSDYDPEQSVLMPMNEALKPLPSRVSDLPQLLPTLFDMANMLVLPEPKESMLERSLELVTKIIPSDRLAVLFTSDDQDEIYTGALHLPGGKDPGTFTLSRTIVKNILADKNAILIDDVGHDPRFSEQQSIIASDLKSAMAVPLLDQDRVLGILYADTTNPVHRYSDDYLHLFAMIGNIIASRLTNYNLLQERHVKEIYEAELKKASSIQKKLLPRNIPEVSGYSVHAFQEQCRAVGGDLYDLEMLMDGRLLFLVADVSGKGMGAALLMSNILASFRILYLEEDFNLTRAVNQVSLELFKHSAPENFATLFVGILDPETHTITFVNAGHNPPMVIRRNGEKIYLEASGAMIGAFDIISWSEETINLDPGDFLLVFTDGVTEAEKGDDFYGDERLEQLVISNRDCQPSSLARLIVSDVEKYVEGTPRSDDITMMIIKRNQ
jgi:serine phosphatase RsbU (regulator of sigma subunit)